MSDQLFERAVIDWLDDGSDRTPRRAIDGVLLAVKTTPQERDLRIPWRYFQMPALTRATGVAAVALVAAVSVGGLLYLNAKQPGGAGTPTTPAPTEAPTTAPTTASPRPTLTPAPAFDPSSPTAWTSHTSEIYDFTLAYPSDWSVYSEANTLWKPGMASSDIANWTDVFINDEAVDGDSIAMWFSQAPAPEGADLKTWDGLKAAYLEVCALRGPTGANDCTVDSESVPLCLGTKECQPAMILVVGSEESSPDGFFADPETGEITIFSMGRPEGFPASARYGGTIALLKAILAQVDVREPEPGETPR